MEFVAITHPGVFEEEAEAVAGLSDLGIRVHLRKPGWSRERLQDWLEKLAPRALVHIVPHAHWDLVREYPVGGTHGPLDRLPEPSWAGGRSGSLHTLKELAGAPAEYDYVFISPVFPSLSKPGYRDPLPRAALRELLGRRTGFDSPRVYALGGVCVDNLEEVRTMGFDGAAALGALWKGSARDAITTAERMLEQCTGNIPSY